MSAKLGEKQNITAVNNRGDGGGGGHAGGGGHGGEGGARDGGGNTGDVPLVGAMNYPHTSQPRRSDGGTLINYISLHCTILAFLASFFLVCF